MAHALIGWDNKATAGTLTAGSEAPGLGVAGIQGPLGSPSTAWQTAAGVTSSWFQVSRGLVLIWGALGLFRTNLTSAATVRWRVGYTTGGASPTWDSGVIAAGVVPGFGQSVTIPPAGTNGSYLYCDISDPTNPDGFLNIPLVFGGPVWTPASNIAPTTTRGRDDATAETVTRGGQEYPLLLWQRRRWNIGFQGIRTAEIAAQVDNIDLASRLGQNILVVPDPVSSNINRDTTFGRWKTTADLSFYQNAQDRRAWSASITERL